MNDLKNGILDINGFLLGPNTTVDEMESYFGVKATHNPYRSHVKLDKQAIDNKDLKFNIDASFKERLVQVTLYPCCPEIAAKYDLTNYSNDWLPYYQELRVIMDKWLLEQLGEPRLQNEHGTEYKIGNILIGTDSYVDERARDYRVVGGSIDIYYR